jgi:hypothetical protein
MPVEVLRDETTDHWGECRSKNGAQRCESDEASTLLRGDNVTDDAVG